MNRNPHQHREFSTPSDLDHAGHAGKTIYTLPVDALVRLGQLASDEASRGHLEALFADQAIDLRVDWDGSASSMGQFEVLVSASTWKACELIDPDDIGIDVISLSQAPLGTTYLARFRRGPAHAGCIFGVKAVPIVWTQELPAQLAASYVAERGNDYEYQAQLQPELVPWTYSVLAGGVQRLNLELSMASDYEIWVRLQHPTNPDSWRIQDPIVRQPVPTVARKRGPA